MHAEALEFITRTVERFGPFDSMLELGSRNINGGVRQLFGEDVVGLDIVDGDGVDIVADAAVWKPHRKFGCVVSAEVFEHAVAWPDIVSTAYEALEPGGVVILTMAGPGRPPHSAVDGGTVRPGEYYDNVRPYDLRSVLELVGFTGIELERSNPGDLYAVATR